MPELVSQILSIIENGSLAASFANLDCNAALDARDHNRDFETSWCRLLEEVERRWQIIDLPQHLRNQVEAVRQRSFYAVSRVTGQHEIASYVSDDLELIARAHLLLLDSPLLKELWDAYHRGTFPH